MENKITTTLLYDETIEVTNQSEQVLTEMLVENAKMTVTDSEFVKTLKKKPVLVLDREDGLKDFHSEASPLLLARSVKNIGNWYIIQVGKGKDIQHKLMLFQKYQRKTGMYYFIEQHIAGKYFMEESGVEEKKRNHYWLFATSMVVSPKKIVGMVEDDKIFFNYFRKDYSIFLKKELEKIENKKRRVRVI